jgi:hypothetical protein
LLCSDKATALRCYESCGDDSDDTFTQQELDKSCAQFSSQSATIVSILTQLSSATITRT